MKNKLNCVEMKYKGAKKIQAQIKDYNIEEELNFWKSRSDDLQNRKKNLQNNKPQVMHV